jgi:hypothetical protein
MVDPILSFAELQMPRSLPEAARLIEGSYLALCHWIEAHLPQAGTLIAGASLSLYGRYITDGLRRTMVNWPFIVRAGIYIALVGLGFGAIIGTVAPLVTSGLRLISTPYLVPAFLCALILVGILAERSGRI